MNRARVISNLLFLVPFYLAIHWGVFWYVVVLGLSLVVSLLYHGLHESRFGTMDIVTAWLLMAGNMWLLVLGYGRPTLLLVLTILTAMLATWLFVSQTKQNYGLRHPWYHVCSVMVCTFSLFVFHF